MVVRHSLREQIREALRELVAMGVLESAPHRGVWVREVSVQETIEALEVRATLDALVLRKAGRRLQKQIGPLRKIVAAIVEAAERRDLVAFQQHNQAFHRAILEAAGNRALIRCHDALAFEVRTRFVLNVISSVDPVVIAREHEGILDALARGDVREAVRREVRHSRWLISLMRKERKAAAQAERRI